MTCSWMTKTMPSVQCRWPGAYSNGLHGDGRWRCYMHHKLSSDGLGDTALADNVATESLDWDGSALDYIHYRKKFDDTPRPKPVSKHSAPESVFQSAWKLLQKKRVADAA